MLIRIGGGAAGIKEYLEDGAKQGRAWTRDQLDERVIIAGDLEVTNSIIRAMESGGERYLHITLAFKEDAVDAAMLANVVRQFEGFAFAAYRKDEYCFYAEAHLPRVKSYINARTGEFVERKPHIHIVIPKMNLVSGHHLNPFGAVLQNTRFVDAFQEDINNQLGFASPKENRRVGFSGASEMISRSKGDVFRGANKEIRGAILAAIMARSIDSYVAFEEMLSEFGDARVRNAGRPDEYHNIKAPGASKGVNLRDYVFTREFVELPIVEKRKVLAAADVEPSNKYDTAGEPRVSPPEVLATLGQWREVRSREIRWVNSGAKRAWNEYRAADAEGRMRIIAAREYKFNQQYHAEESHEQLQQRTTRSRSADHRQRSISKVTTLATARNKNSLPSLSGSDMARGPRDTTAFSAKTAAAGTEMLLHDDANDRLGDVRADASGALRRISQVDRWITGRHSDTVLGQIVRDMVEERTIDRAEIDEIKLRLDANRLLADLSLSHGVLLEKYAVIRAEDGSARIECGARRLNVSDFLTKEMRLSWAEAAPLLQDAYARQVRGETPREPQRAPRRAYWSEFMADRKKRTAANRVADGELRRTAAAERIAIKRRFDPLRDSVRCDRRLTPASRQTALGVVREERLAAESALRRRIQGARDALKETRLPREQYRTFLVALAEGGDVQALHELRRMRVSRADGAALAVLSAESRIGVIAGGIQAVTGLAHRIDADGGVTYHRDGVDLVRDVGDAVQVLHPDADAIAVALHIAALRLGRVVDVSGPDHLRTLVASVAADVSSTLTFADPGLEALMFNRRAELDAALARVDETRRLAREFARQREAAAAQHVVSTLSAEFVAAPSTEATLALVDRLVAALDDGDVRRAEWATLREIDAVRLDGDELRMRLEVDPDLRRVCVAEIEERLTEIEEYEAEQVARRVGNIDAPIG